MIPPHTRVEGRIETPGDLLVEGRCGGELHIGGTLTVAADATCKATAKAHRARIYGEMIGNIVCGHSIEIAAGARVVGDLRAPDISIDSRSEVDGKVDLLAPAPEEASIERVPMRARGPAPGRPSPPPKPEE